MASEVVSASQLETNADLVQARDTRKAKGEWEFFFDMLDCISVMS